MAIGIRRMRVPACVVSSCVACLLLAPAARAGFEVDLYEGSTLLKSIQSTNGFSVSYSGTVGDFSVNLSYDLVNNGLGVATAGPAKIVNNDARNTRTFTIVVKDEGVLNFPGGSTFGSANLAGIARSGSESLVAKAISGSSASPNMQAGSGLIGSEYDVQYGPYQTYSLSMYAGFRLVPLSTIVFSQSDMIDTTANLPGPSGLALAVAGLPCVVGFWCWKRRRPGRESTA